MKAGGKKNALDREIGADGKREWSFGLFDCFSACNICMSDRPTKLRCMLTRSSSQAAWPPCALVSFLAGTGSVFIVCRIKALLCQTAAKDASTTASMAALSHTAQRLIIAPTSAIAMTFVAVMVVIALPSPSVFRVHSHKNAGKSS